MSSPSQFKIVRGSGENVGAGSILFHARCAGADVDVVASAAVVDSFHIASGKGWPDDAYTTLEAAAARKLDAGTEAERPLIIGIRDLR